jgi:hypothetical protein|tara:strand:+ start:1397 stop:1558 length:162 start_codon:yes stop_codon:yes gene_type:complete
MSKKEKFDGRSRPTNKAYDEGWARIFDRKKFERLQQEQRDGDEEYQKSKDDKS